MQTLLFKQIVPKLSQDLLEYLFKRYKLAAVGVVPQPLERYFDGGIFDNLDDVLSKYGKDIILITEEESSDSFTRIRFRSEQQLKNDLVALQPEIKYLQPERFKCTKCGECCRPIVKVDEEDIRRLESVGYKRDDFLEYDPLQDNPPEKDTLKQVNNVCMFLKRRKDEFICSIYENRPKNCRVYPFYSKEKIEECVPHYLMKPIPIKDLVTETK